MTVPAEPTPASPPRWFLPTVGALIVAFIAATNIGNVVWANWITEHPLGLIALNSSNKFLLGTSTTTDIVPFFVIATLRLMLPDPLFWLLGNTYRERALHWGRQAFPAMGPLFEQFESDRGAFRRLLDALVVIMPNNPVSLLAGVAAMPFRRFMLLNLIGTLGRIALVRIIGAIFESQIEDVLDLIARYQGWLTRASLIAVVALVAWQVFDRRGLVGGVETLEEELGGEPPSKSEPE